MKLPKDHGVCRHLFRIAIGGALLALAGASGAKAAITMENAVHVPTSGWLVGPATMAPAAAGEKMPCLMVNQFDNGYTLRFSGGGDRIMAVAIDFRSPSLNPGDSYPVNISVKDIFSKLYQGIAYNNSTLIVNMEGSEEFYHSLADSRILAFGLNGSLFEFAMLGVKDGLRRVESCYTPERGQLPLVPAGAAKKEPAGFSLRNTGRNVSYDSGPALASANHGAEAAGQEAGRPGYGSEVQASARGGPVNGLDSSQHELLPLPVSAPVKGIDADLGAVISEAAARLHETGNEDQVRQPAAFAGSPVATPAVGATSGGPGDQPVVTTRPRPLGTAPATARHPDILVARKGENDAAQAKEAADVKHWRAIKGANLREVLDVWTQGSDKDLAWMADREFPVEKSLIFRGTFESAVLTLLEQYNGESERPVGRIYRDPLQDKQILLIQTAR